MKTGISDSGLNLTHDRFLRLPVRLAPRHEQDRIVAKIEELFSDLDAGVAALERVRIALKRYRASVLKAAVEGRLTEQWREENPDVEPADELLRRILDERRSLWEKEQIAKYDAKGTRPPEGWRQKYKGPEGPDIAALPELPDSWCWATVSHVSRLVTDGDHNPPPRVPIGVPHLTSKHIKNQEISLSDCTYITPEDFEKTARRYSPVPGDVVVTCVGTVGEVAVVPDGLVFSADRNLAGVRLVPGGALPAYLQHVLTSPPWQSRIRGASGSTAQPHLYLGDLRAMPVPIPPLAEQQVLVEIIEAHAAGHDVASSWLSTSLVRCACLRQSILKHAFEGKLVPQDPADEPASVLLEHVRDERAAAQAASPKRTRRSRAPRTDNGYTLVPLPLDETE